MGTGTAVHGIRSKVLGRLLLFPAAVSKAQIRRKEKSCAIARLFLFCAVNIANT